MAVNTQLQEVFDPTTGKYIMQPRPGFSSPVAQGQAASQPAFTPPTTSLPSSSNNNSDDYSNTAGYGTALQRFRSSQDPGEERRLYGISGDARAAQQLHSFGQTFSSMFQNYVGRAPTPDEASQFYQQVVAPQGDFPGQGNLPGMQELQDRTKAFINNNFQRQAQQQVQEQLKAQQPDYQGLANAFRTSGTNAIDQYQKQLQTGLSSTESALIDYQNRLFDRLRPQLLTSLQSQGLLNTGGVNEAMAGAQKDLATEGQNYLFQANQGINQNVANARLQNEEGANQIALGAQAAPFDFARSQALSQIPNFLQQGQSAIDRAFSTQQQNLNYNNNLGLLNRQFQLQQNALPSFGRTFTQNFASGLGSSLGNYAVSDANSAAQKSGFLGRGSDAGASKVATGVI